jgi:hypothetical protein
MNPIVPPVWCTTLPHFTTCCQCISTTPETAPHNSGTPHGSGQHEGTSIPNSWAAENSTITSGKGVSLQTHCILQATCKLVSNSLQCLPFNTAWLSLVHLELESTVRYTRAGGVIKKPLLTQHLYCHNIHFVYTFSIWSLYVKSTHEARVRCLSRKLLSQPAQWGTVHVFWIQISSCGLSVRCGILLGCLQGRIKPIQEPAGYHTALSAISWWPPHAQDTGGCHPVM